MTKLVEPRNLKGFRDILPGDAILKGRLLQKLRNVFETFGYSPIETPHLEYTETLFSEISGGDIGKEVFRFEDNGGRDVSLRFDLTVPLARFVVQHKNELGLPFKRYAIGNAFRGEQPQFGRYREFTQCDFDIVGVENGPADCETVQVIAGSLLNLGINRFVIRINNRKVMNGLSENFGLAGDQHIELLRIVDKLDKIGPDEVKRLLCETVKLSAEQATELLDFVQLKSDSPAQLLQSVAPYKERNETLKGGIEELEYLVSVLDQLEFMQGHYKIDLSIARGFGYYTGLVFETNLLDLPKIGSVCSGGRYDNLTKNFSKENLPGVGASIGLDRLLAALEELKLFPSPKSPTQVLCLLLDNNLLGQVSNVANQLRCKGLAVEVYPEAAKFKKQFQYAEKKDIVFVLILGETELAAGKFNLKNIVTGVQVECKSLDEVVALVSGDAAVI